ncbi:MAG: carbohydrate binding domain-containing protein [bacterium]|uniref:Carbohydrate binding domain-containing protein n=1 Tax=Candidatus Methylomirabilis tolerans TaxID=3123416 RepID=A0AAJ1AJF8_9BACT|nr:carbohydrate binding domain-containing protein [Candidatus Methylomirabilis sp.]
MVLRLYARPSRIALTGIMILGFLLASWAALRPWIAQRALSRGPSDQATRRALALDPGNDRIQTSLATLYHYSLLLRDYPAALAAYRSALRNNPLDSASWLHLGKLYADMDQARESDQAFALAVRLGPGNAALLWEIAIAHLDEGRVTEAIAVLTRFLAVSPPNNATRGYELAHRLAPPDEVIGKMIAPDVDHYTHYTNYLLDRHLGDQALVVWDRLDQMAARTREPIDPHLQLRVVDLLMATGRLDQAYQLWTTLTTRIQPDAAPSASNLTSNGNFEHKETVGRGFDWRIGGAPGVAWTFDSDRAYTGRRSLRLTFVKSRADFLNISQLIPVQPHSMYALQAYIKTDGLAGSKGITVEVIDSAEGALAKTDPVGETRDWSPVTMTFRTSGTARTITLRVHGEPPPPYLPPLSGSAWIDNVSLTKVE